MFRHNQGAVVDIICIIDHVCAVWDTAAVQPIVISSINCNPENEK